MVHIKSLAMVKSTHCVPEDDTVDEDLSVYLTPCSQIVQSCAFDEITKESSNKKSQHAGRDHVD